MQNKINFYVFALILSLAACITYNYVSQVEEQYTNPRLRLHKEIIDREAPSPYNYRVLVPWITELSATIACSIGKADYLYAWEIAYAIYDFISLALLLTTLFVFLRIWYSVSLSMVGVFFCAALLPMSLRDHYFQPWSLIEAWFFCLAFLLSYKRNFSLLVMLTILAAFNRVTAIFIPLIYFLGSFRLNWIRERHYKKIMKITLNFIFMLLSAIVVILFVRYFQGHQEHVITISQLWRRNTNFFAMMLSTKHWVLFLGAGWIIAYRGWRESGVFLRYQTLLIPIYLIPVLIFGVWREVRLLLPLYPILIALMLNPIQKEITNQVTNSDKK